EVAALTTHAPHELTVGDSGGHEDRVVALDQVVGLVDLAHVEPGVDPALALFIVAGPEDALDVAAERLDGARGDYALRAAADAHAHVRAGVVTRGVDPARDVAVAHQASARAGIPDLLDELLVSRAVQHRHHHLLD